MRQERKFIMPPEKPKPGWPCPKCHGIGHLKDGFFGYSRLEDGSTEVTVRDPTKCSLCLGFGRVNVTPIVDEPCSHTPRREP